MKYYNLGTSSKPCGILKWRGLTIMLDCALDISTVLNYLPLPLAGNSKFNSSPHFQNFKNIFEKELCEINGSVLVDSTPKFGVGRECSIDISQIDVILVSNSSSILALPFFTENPEFNGICYATEPTVNIGRFFMEELVEFVENVPKPKSKNEQDKNELHVFKLLEQSLNFPIKTSNSNFNKDLKEIYSRKSISDALLKVKIVGFSENLDIFGKIIATPVSSGFSLGSCNWILKSENKKIVYVTSSSTLTTHPSPMEQNALKEADVFILTGLTQVPTLNPDTMMAEICLNVINSLKNGGNAIFPCYPSGIIYDLFECLNSHLESHGYGTYPFYFISPHAESSLAYSNILAEWLSNSKQKKVYLPEDPFPHAMLIKDGKLKHFKTLHDVHELRQPCVIFVGHPSIRFGDVVHLIESWGQNHNNTVIFTEAEFPYLECLIPFQPLSMKVAYCPIDTSLNFHQVNKLIKELKIRTLVTHEEYLCPPKDFPQRTDLVVDFPNIEKISPGSFISIKLKRDYISTVMDSKLAQEAKPTFRGDNGIAICTVTANVENMDNKYKLLQPSLDQLDQFRIPPQKYQWGTLKSSIVLHKLSQEGITNTKIQHTANGFVITIHPQEVKIITECNQTNIICNKDDESFRIRLRKILVSCLEEF